MRLWKRRLSDDERSVLLSELLLRHPGPVRLPMTEAVTRVSVMTGRPRTLEAEAGGARRYGVWRVMTLRRR